MQYLLKLKVYITGIKGVIHFREKSIRLSFVPNIITGKIAFERTTSINFCIAKYGRVIYELIVQK